MALYIVQHGKSLPKSDDPGKGLSQDGKDETERIAGVAAGYLVRVTGIVHSGKKRARQTAEILARQLAPPEGLDVWQGMNPLDDVRAFGQRLDVDRNLMLVGHLPFLERLIGLLVCGDPEQLIFKLQNSGIVCLDRVDGTSHPVIRWALMPTIG